MRELIAQNHAEMLGLWPEAPAGIYSAGLGRREADARILFAGIQSVHRKAAEIGHCDLVLIDEAHLIPAASATMYRRFLDELTAINPKLKVIGFTATPYRLDSGMLHEGEGALFTDIAYEVSVRDLIDQGYLCPLVSKQPKTRLDVAGVGSRGGEFIASELQAAVDKEAITRAAVSEIIAYGADRKSWLAFCSGVDHARHVAEEFRSRGITCATIFGDTPKDERDRDHRRLQAAGDPGACLDGRADHRLQRAGGRPHRHAAPHEVRRALRPDGGPRHAAGAGQGELPRPRLRRQCQPPRAHRPRAAAEAGRRRWGRGAHKGLPGMREHPSASLRANAPTVATSFRRRR